MRRVFVGMVFGAALGTPLYMFVMCFVPFGDWAWWLTALIALYPPAIIGAIFGATSAILAVFHRAKQEHAVNEELTRRESSTGIKEL